MSESEKFALATHVYVHLRRANGRVVDAVWMAHNDDYAWEIIGISRGVPADTELQSLCDRFEALLRKTPARPSPQRTNGAGSVTPPPKNHYVGTLR